jgi:plastocyanin
MNRFRWLLPLLYLCVVLMLTACGTTAAPRTLTVLVGGGQDTTQLLAFFPEKVKIRVGDTVNFKLNSEEIHTVTFTSGERPPGATQATVANEPLAEPGRVIPVLAVPVPGGNAGEFMINPIVGFPTRQQGAPIETYDGKGYRNSGILSKQPPAPGAPPNDNFSLTFTQAGTFKYLCILHPDVHKGLIEVVSADTADAPDQARLDAQAKAEMAPLLAQVEAAHAQGQEARKEGGPNGTTVWHVRAGAVDFLSGDLRAQAFEFLPKQLTIKSGDTVVWGSFYFHSVVFRPTPEPAEPIIVKPQPQGPPLLLFNPLVFAPSKPSGIYDPTKYYNSSDLGFFSPGGFSWALTFDRPGTYQYYCGLHETFGMKGSLIVQAR